MRQVLRRRILVPIVTVVVLVVAFFTIPGLGGVLPQLWGKVTRDDYVPPKVKNDDAPADLVFDAKGNAVGLRLSDEAIRGVKPGPIAAKDPNIEPKQQRALPPQFGTVNYDNDRLFIIRSRFPGEVAEFLPQNDVDSGITPTQFRPLRVGDKVRQGELLAVVWSQPLGQAKSALVDAICSLALSKKQYELKDVAFKEAALSLATMMGQERQLQADTLTKLSAERSLRMWKLSPDDIKEIEKEAEELRKLIEAKKERDPQKEAEKWARVEIRAPIFKFDGRDPSKPDPNVMLTVVEKNTNINDMLDPIASPPMFKLADLSRLQVMVQPHEEYYPILRDQLQKNKLTWKVQVTAYPNAKPLEPKIVQVLPSVDPGLRTCIVTGFLQSPDMKYLVGQHVTATIFVDPEEGTVEIPTNALNDAEGESLVFVQDPKDKQTFYMRRVSVTQRFKEFSYVRSVLTERDKQISQAEVEKNKRRIEVLLPGEIVITHGIVELKAAFDNMSATDRLEKLQLQGN